MHQAAYAAEQASVGAAAELRAAHEAAAAAAEAAATELKRVTDEQAGKLAAVQHQVRKKPPLRAAIMHDQRTNTSMLTAQAIGPVAHAAAGIQLSQTATQAGALT